MPNLFRKFLNLFCVTNLPAETFPEVGLKTPELVSPHVDTVFCDFPTGDIYTNVDEYDEPKIKLSQVNEPPDIEIDLKSKEINKQLSAPLKSTKKRNKKGQFKKVKAPKKVSRKR